MDWTGKISSRSQSLTPRIRLCCARNLTKPQAVGRSSKKHAKTPTTSHGNQRKTNQLLVSYYIKRVEHREGCWAREDGGGKEERGGCVVVFVAARRGGQCVI